MDSGWVEFENLCLKAQNIKRLDQILKLFLTIEEQDLISKRFLIIQALLKGDKSQRVISKELGLSISKITRGSNFLKTLDDEFIEYLRCLIN